MHCKAALNKMPQSQALRRKGCRVANDCSSPLPLEFVFFWASCQTAIISFVLLGATVWLSI